MHPVHLLMLTLNIKETHVHILPFFIIDNQLPSTQCNYLMSWDNYWNSN